MMLALYPQVRDSANYSCLLTHVAVLRNKSGRRGVCRANPALNNHAFKERDVSSIINTPGIYPAQYQDPLIVNARLVNLAAEIERNLAARKALRPARSAAARLGWERRK